MSYKKQKPKFFTDKEDRVRKMGGGQFGTTNPKHKSSYVHPSRTAANKPNSIVLTRRTNRRLEDVQWAAKSGLQGRQALFGYFTRRGYSPPDAQVLTERVEEQRYLESIKEKQRHRAYVAQVAAESRAERIVTPSNNIKPMPAQTLKNTSHSIQVTVPQRTVDLQLIKAQTKDVIVTPNEGETQEELDARSMHFVEMYRRGEVIPPPLLHQLPNGKLEVVDGRARANAYRMLGVKEYAANENGILDSLKSFGASAGRAAVGAGKAAASAAKSGAKFAGETAGNFTESYKQAKQTVREEAESTRAQNAKARQAKAQQKLVAAEAKAAELQAADTEAKAAQAEAQVQQLTRGQRARQALVRGSQAAGRFVASAANQSAALLAPAPAKTKKRKKKRKTKR